MGESSSDAMVGESAARAAVHSYGVVGGEPAARVAALRDGEQAGAGSRRVSTATAAGGDFRWCLDHYSKTKFLLAYLDLWAKL